MNTVKTFVKCHSKIDKTKILMTNCNLMSPYIFTLVQKVKHRVYKIHAFLNDAILAQTLQVLSFKNDVNFLHGRS